MSRKPMRSVAFIASMIWLCGCPSVVQSGGAEIRLEGTYVHRPSGLVFPETIGRFRRVTARQFDADGNDVGVGYNVEEPELQIALTVYVRPRFEGADGHPFSLEDQFKIERDTVVQQHAGAQSTPTQPAPATPNGGPIRGFFASFCYQGVFANTDQQVSSLLYLYGQSGWWVKYRITYPSSQEHQANMTAQEFVSSFKWTGGR